MPLTWLMLILCTYVLVSNNYKEILPPVGRQNDKAAGVANNAHSHYSLSKEKSRGMPLTWLLLNLMYLCTYVQKLKRDSSSRWSSE